MDDQDFRTTESLGEWESRPRRVTTAKPLTELRGPKAVVVGLAVVGFAGFINWWYCDMLVAHHAMRSWQEVPAKIIEDGLKTSHHGKGGSTSRATATYTYEFAGRSYTGNRVTWDMGSDSMGSFQSDTYQQLERHRASGRPVPCFVNPAHPEQAILYRDLRPEILVLLSALELWLGLPLVLVLLNWLWNGVFVRALSWDESSVSANPIQPPQSTGEVVESVKAASWLGRAVWTTIAAVTYNALTIPLFIYLPEAPERTFWPKVFGLLLCAIGWLIAWQAVVAWRTNPSAPKFVMPQWGER